MLEYRHAWISTLKSINSCHAQWTSSRNNVRQLTLRTLPKKLKTGSCINARHPKRAIFWYSSFLAIRTRVESSEVDVAIRSKLVFWTISLQVVSLHNTLYDIWWWAMGKTLSSRLHLSLSLCSCSRLDAFPSIYPFIRGRLLLQC